MPRVELICKQCNEIISFETEDMFYAFNCRFCNTIYAYSNNGSSVNIEMVRAGIIIPFEIKKSFSLLDLSLSCLSEELIKMARRKQMDVYHPDKIFSLGREYIEIANNKAKEINTAYELIMIWYNDNKEYFYNHKHDCINNKNRLKQYYNETNQDFNEQIMWTCPKCNCRNSDNSFICSNCGYTNNSQWGKIK